MYIYIYIYIYIYRAAQLKNPVVILPYLSDHFKIDCQIYLAVSASNYARTYHFFAFIFILGRSMNIFSKWRQFLFSEK